MVNANLILSQARCLTPPLRRVPSPCRRPPHQLRGRRARSRPIVSCALHGPAFTGCASFTAASSWTPRTPSGLCLLLRASGREQRFVGQMRGLEGDWCELICRCCLIGWRGADAVCPLHCQLSKRATRRSRLLVFVSLSGVVGSSLSSESWLCCRLNCSRIMYEGRRSAWSLSRSFLSGTTDYLRSGISFVVACTPLFTCSRS